MTAKKLFDSDFECSDSSEVQVEPGTQVITISDFESDDEKFDSRDEYLKKKFLSDPMKMTSREKYLTGGVIFRYCLVDISVVAKSRVIYIYLFVTFLKFFSY